MGELIPSCKFKICSMLKWIIYFAVECSGCAADAFSTKAERGGAERDVQTGDDLLEGILTTSVVAHSDGTDETRPKTLENVQTAASWGSQIGFSGYGKYQLDKKRVEDKY